MSRTRIVGVIVSILIGTILTYFMYLFTNNFVHIVDRSLIKFFDLRFGYWSLQKIVLGLTVGTVPMISLIPWVIRGHTNFRSLVAFNLFTSLMITIFIAGTALLMVSFSPRGIFDTVKQPHIDFWNYVFVGSSILTILILSIFSILTKRKFKEKNRYSASKAQIDQ